MKNKLLVLGTIGLTGALLSSFMLVQKGDENQEPKKSRHIKMTKIENGKKMELDTVFTNDDVFVWKGDTVNPMRHIGKFRSSGFDKMHPVDVEIDRRIGKEFKHHGGKSGEPMILNMDSDDHMEIVTEDNDSVGKRMIVRKRMKDGAEDHLIFRNDGNEMLVPPPPPPPPPAPPVPPFPHLKVMKLQHSGQIIDLNDPNIVSYKKRDVKGGMEKIEIIRKKSENQENMTFDFNSDSEFRIPEPPDAPEFNWQSEDDSLRMKIIEKRKVIKGKDGKEIEVKVETEENK